MNEHQKIFRLASILLQYPSADWVHEDLIWEVRSLTDKHVQEPFLRFLDYLENTPLIDACETYVRTFDFSDKTTLYLTYSVFGDNRDRGPAFLKLKEEFAQAGFPLEDDELPDYLPLILEFASLAPPEHALKVFMIHKWVIDRLLADLHEAQNPYRWVLQGCVLAIDSLIAEREAS